MRCRRRAAAPVVAGWMLLALVMACGPVRQLAADDARHLRALEAGIARAERLGALDCAPMELARAHVLLDHAGQVARRSAQGTRVARELQTAQRVVDTLLARTESCWQARQRQPRGKADGDGDGVDDYKDRCPDTSPGVTADAVGCALDSDRDGVIDVRDSCPFSLPGARVDPAGCRLAGDGAADGVVAPGTSAPEAVAR